MNLGNGRQGTEFVDVVVVGAGQAGLTVSYYLRSFDIEHIVLERGSVGKAGEAPAGTPSRWLHRTG
jgi:cation diffusion facilitator CzcD-associated flavoprotein CzcO